MSRATQDSKTFLLTSQTGLSPALAKLSSLLCSLSKTFNLVLQHRLCRNIAGLGSSPVARRYWGNHYYFLFLRVLRCFSSPRLPHYSIVISVLHTDGLSHSEIFGSLVICTYPKLIAAYHVLHRLREPRHPPCALSYFLVIIIPLKEYMITHTFSC